MRWYKKGEIYRFDQPIGKQYKYGHGPEYSSEDERINNQINHLTMENEILKKYIAMKRKKEPECYQHSSPLGISVLPRCFICVSFS